MPRPADFTHTLRGSILSHDPRLQALRQYNINTADIPDRSHFGLPLPYSKITLGGVSIWHTESLLEGSVSLFIECDSSFILGLGDEAEAKRTISTWLGLDPSQLLTLQGTDVPPRSIRYTVLIPQHSLQNFTHPYHQFIQQALRYLGIEGNTPFERLFYNFLPKLEPALRYLKQRQGEVAGIEKRRPFLNWQRVEDNQFSFTLTVPSYVQAIPVHGVKTPQIDDVAYSHHIAGRIKQRGGFWKPSPDTVTVQVKEVGVICYDEEHRRACAHSLSLTKKDQFRAYVRNRSKSFALLVILTVIILAAIIATNTMATPFWRPLTNFTGIAYLIALVLMGLIFWQEKQSLPSKAATSGPQQQHRASIPPRGVAGAAYPAAAATQSPSVISRDNPLAKMQAMPVVPDGSPRHG